MTGLLIIGLIAAIAFIALVAYLSREPCPSCGTRGSVRWLHARVDGGPDRRYAENYRLCGCGWTDRAPVPSHLSVAAEITRRYEEDRLRRQAEAEAERRRVDEERVERAVVWMLKYIAMADRRRATGEEQMLREEIRSLFTADRHRAVERWANQVKVDSAADYDRMVEALCELPVERRQQIHDRCASMAAADGKATKSETTRLAKLRAHLRLDDSWRIGHAIWENGVRGGRGRQGGNLGAAS